MIDSTLHKQVVLSTEKGMNQCSSPFLCLYMLYNVKKCLVENGFCFSDLCRKTFMKKEVAIHIQHLTVTFDRLIGALFTDYEIDLMSKDRENFAEHISTRSKWVMINELVMPGVTTERMVLIHLLWFQSIGRVVIEDIDPLSGALRLHLFIQKNSTPILT